MNWEINTIQNETKQIIQILKSYVVKGPLRKKKQKIVVLFINNIIIYWIGYFFVYILYVGSLHYNFLILILFSLLLLFYLFAHQYSLINSSVRHSISLCILAAFVPSFILLTVFCRFKTTIYYMFNVCAVCLLLLHSNSSTTI